MKRRELLAMLLSLCVTGAVAQPSEPVSGMRWVVNEATSDEFETNEFDHKKWYNSDPKSWKGRFPGLFMPEAMSVSDGKLHITVDKFPEPVEFKDQMWTHRGGHIYSKAELMVGSYAECSMKANKTFMSSTFWLITGRAGDRTGCDRRTTELDVQECIGYPFDHKKTTQMGSNTHSRAIPEGCDVPKGSKGEHCEVSGKVYDDYHIYGVWWKSPTEILFYLDGEYKYTITPAAPFNLPMVVKLVCETYNWSKPPADGGMTGSFSDRSTSYEWVRCYTSIPVEKKQSKQQMAANAIFEESVKVAVDSETKPAQCSLIYSSAKGGNISVKVKNSDGKVVASASHKALSGVGNIPAELKLGSLPAGKYDVTAEFGSKSAQNTFEIK